MPVGHEGEGANRVRRERRGKSRVDVEFDGRSRSVGSQGGWHGRTEGGAIWTVRAVTAGYGGVLIARNLPLVRIIVTILGVIPCGLVAVVRSWFCAALGRRLGEVARLHDPAGAEAGRHQQQEGKHSREMPANHLARPAATIASVVPERRRSLSIHCRPKKPRDCPGSLSTTTFPVGRGTQGNSIRGDFELLRLYGPRPGRQRDAHLPAPRPVAGRDLYPHREAGAYPSGLRSSSTTLSPSSIVHARMFSMVEMGK